MLYSSYVRYKIMKQLADYQLNWYSHKKLNLKYVSHLGRLENLLWFNPFEIAMQILIRFDPMLGSLHPRVLLYREQNCWLFSRDSRDNFLPWISATLQVIRVKRRLWNSVDFFIRLNKCLYGLLFSIMLFLRKHEVKVW